MLTVYVRIIFYKMLSHNIRYKIREQIHMVKWSCFDTTKQTKNEGDHALCRATCQPQRHGL